VMARTAARLEGRQDVDLIFDARGEQVKIAWTSRAAETAPPDPHRIRWAVKLRQQTERQILEPLSSVGHRTQEVSAGDSKLLTISVVPLADGLRATSEDCGVLLVEGG